MMMLVSTMLRSLSTSSGNLQRPAVYASPSPSSGSHRPPAIPAAGALNWSFIAAIRRSETQPLALRID